MSAQDVGGALDIVKGAGPTVAVICVVVAACGWFVWWLIKKHDAAQRAKDKAHAEEVKAKDIARAADASAFLEALDKIRTESSIDRRLEREACALERGLLRDALTGYMKEQRHDFLETLAMQANNCERSTERMISAANANQREWMRTTFPTGLIAAPHTPQG